MRYHGKLEQCLAHYRCSVNVSHCGCHSQAWKGRCSHPEGPIQGAQCSGPQSQPGSQCPCRFGYGQASHSGPDSRSRWTRPGSSVGPQSWDRLLPSSVLGARQAHKPPDVSRSGLLSDGRKWVGAPGTDEPGRRALRQ